jgi:hypothetical protein
MPLNSSGDGPADPNETVRVEHQVWDAETNLTMFTAQDETTALAVVEAWNRRTPAPEGEAVAWGCFDANDLDDKLVYRDRRRAEDAAFAFTPSLTVKPLYASPVVPVGSGETLPPISLDGPHKIGEHRQWLARQLLDSRQDDAEAYSTVIYSPAMTDIWRDGVVPVGVSREEIVNLAEGIITRRLITIATGGEPAAIGGLIADVIIAALRPTDTGRE